MQVWRRPQTPLGAVSTASKELTAVDHFLEEAYILTGTRRGRVWLLRCHRPMLGTPDSVEADWHWALRREERYGDVAGFYHTQPPIAGTRPSRRDVRTMRAWCGSFGKPMLGVIAAGEQIKTVRFTEEQGFALPITEMFARGYIVVVEGASNG
jgi:hypothetical protein